MQASGLLESIKIHTSGYEFRESIESFVDKFWPICIQKSSGDSSTRNSEHMTFDKINATFAGNDPSKQIMPDSMEDYVTKIFNIASKGDPENPLHPIQKQWALGITQVFMKGPAKHLIQ